MKTGFYSWKIAKGLYFVPLIIAYTPFLSGNWPEMLQIFFFSIFGLWALSAGIEGYWENKLNIALRLLVLGTGVALLWPTPVWTNLVALAAFAVLFTWNIKGPKTGPTSSPTSEGAA